MTNFKTNTFKFIRPLYKFLRKALGIPIIFDFTYNVLLKDITLGTYFQCYALKSFLDNMHRKFSFPSPMKRNLENPQEKEKKDRMIILNLARVIFLCS
jgi:hypothetical protein